MMSDPIEIHLTYLRTGLDEVKATLPVLRDKLDALSSTLDAKIEKINAKIEKTNDRIDRVSSTVSARIDRLSERVENVNSTLTNGLADVRGVQKAMFWVLGSAGALTTLASMAQVARAFNWL